MLGSVYLIRNDRRRPKRLLTGRATIKSPIYLNATIAQTIAGLEAAASSQPIQGRIRSTQPNR